MSTESILCETCSLDSWDYCSTARLQSPIETETAIDQSLSTLESQITELKSLILQKESEADVYKENKRPRARFEPASWPPQLPDFDKNPRIGSFSDSPIADPKSRASVENASYASNNQGLASLELRFTKKELLDYTELRLAGISKASVPWMKRNSRTFWNHTKGVISKERCDALRAHLSARYTDIWAPRKVMNFATAFLKYLAKTHFDPRYQAFELFLEMPKGLKARKHVTSRIVTKEDVENVLLAIRQAYEKEEIDNHHCLSYRAIVLFGAFTGQRPQATVARLSVGQFRSAVCQKKPVLELLPEHDKIRMQHYCPLHPQVVEAVAPLVRQQRGDEPMFKQLSFERWLKQQKVPLVHGSYHFVPGDLRKFCEQMGDILQWDQSNKNYILTHGVSGVDWRFYKSPRPAPVFDIYMKYWGDFHFTSSGELS